MTSGEAGGGMPGPDDRSNRRLPGHVTAGDVPTVRARTATWTGEDGRPVVGFEGARMTHRQEGRHTVVTLAGELGVYEAPTLRNQLRVLIDQGGGDLIVDLRAVELLDSTNLGVLVWALRRLRGRPGGRTLYVVAHRTDGPAERIVRTVGLSRVFHLCDSVTDALHAATTPPDLPSPGPIPPDGQNGSDPHA